MDDDANGFVDDVNGWDFCNGDNTVHEGNDGVDTHGTHVAGSIAASGNSVGIAGVAPGIKIMAIKIFSNENETCGTDTLAAEAIAYAADNGALIINASWGGYGERKRSRGSVPSRTCSWWPRPATATRTKPGGHRSPTVLPGVVRPAERALGHRHPQRGVPDQLCELRPRHRRPCGARRGHPELGGQRRLGARHGDLDGRGQRERSRRAGGVREAGSRRRTGAADPSHRDRAGAAQHHRLDRQPAARGRAAAVVSRPDIVRLAGTTNRYETAVAIRGRRTRRACQPRREWDELPSTRWRAAPPPPSSASRPCSPTRCRLGATRNEIIRLRPFHIYVLGGGGSVSLAVASQPGNARRNAWRADAADPSAAPEPVRHRGRGVDRVLRPGVATAFIATGSTSSMPWPVHRHRRHSASAATRPGTRFPRRRHKS